MAENKIVLGNSREVYKKKTEAASNDTFTLSPTAYPDTHQEAAQKPLCENVWGNDHKILSMLDEKQRADRRFYARALYMQKIECNFIMNDLESEPAILSRPLLFMIIDISMGGIGIISEYEISIGTVLVFRIILDNISYDVKYEVAYCFQNDGKFRAGLKIAYHDKKFIKHLKILVARLSLQSMYGAKLNNVSGIS